MEKLTAKTELKVGMILKHRITDDFDKRTFGDNYVVFQITKIKGYVFGKILSGRMVNSRYHHAFHIDDKNRKDYWILSEQEGLLYEL